MLPYKQKRSHGTAGGKGGRNQMLISVTFVGSTGPIKFVVMEEQLVAGVIKTALKSYAREGRLPVLGSDINDFVLYCPTAGTEGLSPGGTIGSHGVRNFLLCKKPRSEKTEEKQGKGNGIWRACLNKALKLRISSHLN